MKEDWIRPRSRQIHFTEEEKQRIRQRFVEGKSVTDTARELKASTRTIQWYFTLFRSEGIDRGSKTPSKPANYTARLYKPNFDI